MIATHLTPVEQADPKLWGGKGASLIRLAYWQLPVPPFFVLPSTLFTEVWQRRPVAVGGAAHLRQEVAELAKDPAVGDRLRAIIREGLEALPDGPVAVRSSASDEDAAQASLAGQMDTFLFVPRDVEHVLAHVIRCWQSLFSDRGMSYREQRGLSTDGLSIAVVVQTMSHADRSLVAFSANVLTRDPDEMLVSAAWGLGEGLVSGAVDADQYVLSAKDGAVHDRQRGDQDQKSVRGPEGGVELVPVPPDERVRPVLNEAELKQVWELLKRVQERFGCPVDVEAAFEGGQLYCLQARPITTPIGGRKLLWDNSNVVESYSGVTTPLTFSFANFCYQTVYTQFGRMLGVPRELHDAHERTMKTYIGLVDGRVYYNLLTWYLSMAHLPGFSFTRTAMEGMMGVKESLDYELPAANKGLKKWTHDLPQLVGMVGRALWHFMTVDDLVREFEANFQKVYGAYRDERFQGWDAPRLVELYEDLVNKVMRRWQAPIMSDVGAMVSYALLKKLCANWIQGPEGLQNELLAGEGGIESTQPTKRLMAMAKRIQGMPRAMEVLKVSPEAFFAAIESEPELASLKAEVADWLVRYGDRCMNELKLEEPSLREKPEFMATMLRNYVAMPDLDLEAMEAKERAVRSKAEKLVAEKLGFNPLRRSIFGKVLRSARKHVKNRENMRFARTRMFGVVRRLFLAVGADFASQGVLNAAPDVFYLTIDEIVAYVDGRSVTKNLKALVALRKAEFESFQADEPDERFITRGLPYAHNTYRGAQSAPVEDLGPNVLQGTPCCPGQLEHVTKLIRTPGDDLTLNGEILVAPRTDPGWVALYPAVSGLLIEKGSILSHSAIVARELGLPTIVGVKGLCDRLNRGQRVRMDGTTGRIEILEEEGGPDGP
jgi:pyruvate,water dikinase